MDDRARHLPRTWSLLAVSALAAVLLVALAAVSSTQGQPLRPDPDGAEARSAARKCARPYTARSPWNRRIPRRPEYHPKSATHVAAIGDLSSDPTQYTYPVYEVNRSTPRRTVELGGWFSEVRAKGRRLRNREGGTVRLPIPADAEAAEGTDGQIILVDRKTGDEWGAWQLERSGDSWRIENGYHYNTRWSGVPPQRFVSRGAGVPYLAGLVRPCEIARRRINHALAFAYDYPTGEHVYPATKSDGSSGDPADLPEGARLQLDPTLTRARLRSMGCRGPCLTIARALQRYGMYVIDKSGRPKVMLEYEATAHWRGRLDEKTVAPIPIERFRVLAYGR